MSQLSPEQFLATASEDDLGEIIAQGLVPAGRPGSMVGKYFSLTRQPGLRVRIDTLDSVEYGAEIYEVMQTLPAAGVDLPPSRRYVAGGRGYLFAPEETGRPLDELLQDDPTEACVSEAIQTFTRLGNWLLERTKDDEYTIGDVYEAGMYRYGASDSDPAPKLRLTYLPETLTDDDLFILSLRHFTAGILDIENYTGRRLEDARAIIGEGMEFAPEITIDEDEMLPVIRQALATNDRDPLL